MYEQDWEIHEYTQEEMHESEQKEYEYEYEQDKEMRWDKMYTNAKD